ncbi:ABC transporter permease [Candidatus Bathyarchaeota archaeon]|nr:ABC transporter permease [Candidatus Bathyarchaeota archaeon]
MGLQRIIALTKTDLKKLTREPAVLFMMLLFPLVLTLAFGVSFGALGASQSTTYQMGVVDLNSAGTNKQWSQSLISGLMNTKILSVTMYPDNRTAQLDLIQGKLQAVILIPTNFEESCESFLTWPNNPRQWTNTTIPMYLDSGSIFATQAITPILKQVLISLIQGTSQSITPTPIQIEIPSMVASSKFTQFDYMAPGLFAFASIFLIMMVSGSFTSDRQSGLLRRINVTPTTSTEFMLSHALSNMLTALLQAIIVFATAYLMGFHSQASILGIALAFGICLIFSLCNVGFGLITATIAKTEGAATGIAFMFVLPQMFLGTFVGLAMSGVAQFIGRFVPSYYVTDALTSILLRGAPITSPAILLDVLVVSTTSILVLLLGIILFRKFGRAN